MKRIRIKKGTVGLVYKNGDYQKVLQNGTYWLGFNQSVRIHSLSKNFASDTPLEILLEDAKLARMLEVIDVKDHEIAVMYESKTYSMTLPAGRHVYWKGLVNRTFDIYDKSTVEMPKNIDSNLFAKYAFNKHVRTFEVEAYERALLMIDDSFVTILTGGIYRYWLNNTSIKILKIDTRQLQLEISGQELLTKDKANIRINFDTQYKVVDIEKALLLNKNYEKQLYVAMQLALRRYVGKYTLDDLLDSKEDIATSVHNEVHEMAAMLGVQVLDCGIRDVILTGEMKDIMNQVLVAQKRAQANIITRREETASTRSLLNTAKLMEENEMLFKLKEMEYVEKIADKIGEITLSGNGNMVKQLKDIFATR